MSVIPPALSVFFSVTVDSLALGDWMKMSGLAMTIQYQDRTDSAMTFFHHHLPGALLYNDLTLERPIGPETALTMSWFSAYHMVPVPVTAQIVCLTADREPVMSWELLGVSPRKWQGPSLDAGHPAVGTEQLVLSYQGFM